MMGGQRVSRRFWRLAILAVGIGICGSVLAVLILWGEQPQSKFVRLLVEPSGGGEIMPQNIGLVIPPGEPVLNVETALEMTISAKKISFQSHPAPEGKTDPHWECVGEEQSGTRYAAEELVMQADEPIDLVVDGKVPSSGPVELYVFVSQDGTSRSHSFWYPPTALNDEHLLEVNGTYPPEAKFLSSTAELGPPVCSTLSLYGRDWVLSTWGEQWLYGIIHATAALISASQGSLQMGAETTTITPISLLNLRGEFLVRLENQTTFIEGDADSVTLNGDEQLPARWGFATEFAQDLVIALVSAFVGAFVAYFFAGAEKSAMSI